MNNREYKTPSLAEQGFERLEADILMGKYQWGEKIAESALCAELAVSPALVRDTLLRLKEERLIDETDDGIVVLGLTRKDFQDMCIIRLHIEGLAVRGFIDYMSKESLEELKDAVDSQQRYLELGDREHLRAMDSRFHDAIYRNCGSTIFQDTLAPLHRKLQRYRQLSLSQSGRAEHSVQEHREIYEAIAAKNADLAETLMRSHIQNAMRYLITEKES